MGDEENELMCVRNESGWLQMSGNSVFKSFTITILRTVDSLNTLFKCATVRKTTTFTDLQYWWVNQAATANSQISVFIIADNFVYATYDLI